MVLLVLLWVLWRTDAPAHVQDAGRILLGRHGRPGGHRLHPVLHPSAAVLVGIHVFGATMVWSTVLWFHHGLSDHRPEVGRPRSTIADRSRRPTVASAEAGRTPAPVAGWSGDGRARRRAGRRCEPPRPARSGRTGRDAAAPARWRREPAVESEGPTSRSTSSTDKPWLVIVWNDPINLMSFVTFVFQKLFGYSKEKATKLMLDVHHKGRAVVSSGTRERAELDVYRLHEYGLWATMEPST